MSRSLAPAVKMAGFWWGVVMRGGRWAMSKLWDIEYWGNGGNCGR